MRQVTVFPLYGLSVAIAVGLMILVGGIASIPGCSLMWNILLPGALLAALVFPEGIHSSGGSAYLVVSAILDALLFALPIMWFWLLIEERRKAKEPKT